MMSSEIRPTPARYQDKEQEKGIIGKGNKSYISVNASPSETPLLTVSNWTYPLFSPAQTDRA